MTNGPCEVPGALVGARHPCRGAHSSPDADVTTALITAIDGCCLSFHFPTTNNNTYNHEL